MSLILAMCVFALSMSISPGPVNLITLSAGANHGFKKTLPFVAGATSGFTSLLALIGLGMVQLIGLYPTVLSGLSLAGAGMIFYMGYKIAISRVEFKTGQIAIPSFLQGFFLQLLNPKAWISSVSGVTAFIASGSYGLLAIFCGLYFVICFISVSCWAFAGDRIQLILSSDLRVRIFNRAMGTGLILVALYLVMIISGSLF